ncbi:unnamed protein product [Albugo candida]|nr:unnamed protein product [Albugo candida]|eukprot:CCI44306.1 unnamed protein product [Albugo candida]
MGLERNPNLFELAVRRGPWMHLYPLTDIPERTWRKEFIDIRYTLVRYHLIDSAQSLDLIDALKNECTFMMGEASRAICQQLDTKYRYVPELDEAVVRVGFRDNDRRTFHVNGVGGLKEIRGTKEMVCRHEYARPVVYGIQDEFRDPDARQKELKIKPFDGKEFFLGLGSAS